MKKLRGCGSDLPTDLWRGVRDFALGDEFAERGGTEMAPLSTTANRAVAEEYAVRLSAHRATVLFRLSVRGVLHQGADISFCSCFPGEREFLYPPGIYLEPTGVPPVTLAGWHPIQVVEVKPVYAY